jgi:hypothetical protein
MARKPDVLTVAELLRRKGKLQSPVVVYFDEEQWARLTRRRSPSRGKPPAAVFTLELSEVSGLSGGLGTFKCPPGSPGIVLTKDGKFACKPPVDADPPTIDDDTALQLCGMIVKANGDVLCAGGCGRTRTCRLGSWSVTVPGSFGKRQVRSLACSCGS